MSRFITALCRDLEGNLWVGTEDTSVRRYQQDGKPSGRWTQLTQLDLSDTRVTEAALPHLHGLVALESLRLPKASGKMERSQEIQHLRRALPQCYVDC